MPFLSSSYTSFNLNNSLVGVATDNLTNEQMIREASHRSGTGGQASGGLSDGDGIRWF